MKVAKVTIDSDCDVKALVEKSERRVFYAIQICAIGIILFFLFLVYLMYLMVKIDMDFTGAVAKQHLKTLRRIDALEKRVGIGETNIQESRDSQHASDDTRYIKP